MKKLLMLLAASLVFTACSSGSKDAKNENAEKSETKVESKASGDLLEDGVLTVGTSVDFPPYEFYEGDKVVGIDPEVMEKIGEKLGVKVEFKDMDFNNIIASIQSGRVDMGAAGMTVDAERLKNVDFTDSYANSTQVLLVKKGSDIKTVDDAKGKKIGTQLGTVGDAYAQNDFGKDSVSSFNKYPDAVLALQNGKIDCILMDNTTAKQFVEANDDLEILDSEYANEDYAFAIGKGNDETLKKINDIIKELKDDGTLDEIIGKYIK